MISRRCVAPGRWLTCFTMAGLLAACGGKQQGENEAAPDTKPRPVSSVATPASALPGTPMAERVAVVGILNKRNGLTRDLQMKPGEALRWGAAVVRVRACEQTAPWENTPETGAFVQLDVRETRDNKWYRVFSGWLFKNRPERNVVQHPIYDVWVKSCAMSWPETGAETVRVDGKGAGGRSGATSATSASSAKKSAEEPSGSANESPPSAPPSTDE